MIQGPLFKLRSNYGGKGILTKINRIKSPEIINFVNCYFKFSSSLYNCFSYPLNPFKFLYLLNKLDKALARERYPYVGLTITTNCKIKY